MKVVNSLKVTILEYLGMIVKKQGLKVMFGVISYFLIDLKYMILNFYGKI
jgi:hypothetical protein